MKLKYPPHREIVEWEKFEERVHDVELAVLVTKSDKVHSGNMATQFGSTIWCRNRIQQSKQKLADTRFD